MSDFNLSLGRKGKAGEFESSEIKEGTKKTDLESKISQNIFDALDKDKDGTLSGIEIEKFLAQLKDAAKNDNLSKREAKKLLKLEGIKGVKAEKLYEFLKEIAAVEVAAEDYSAYDDGMGIDIKNKPNPQQEIDLIEEVSEEADEDEVIDNTKAYYENGRVMTLGDDGKSILVQENENSAPVKLQVDEYGNIISYAKNGESFDMTAKRLGLDTEGEVYEKFKELNEKAAKKGYFLVGGKVLVPSEALENLALNKVDVNIDAEITKYIKDVAKKQTEREQAEKEKLETRKKQNELTDEEMREKYPGIARPDEDTKYEPPKFEMPEIPGLPISGNKPVTPVSPTEPPKQPDLTAEKTEAGNPKQLDVTKEDFSIENLRKRYPDDKYTESTDDSGVTSFTDKTTGKKVFEIENSENGNFTAVLYEDGEPSIGLAVKDDEILRVQYDDKGTIISNAVYDRKDNKLSREEILDEDGLTEKTIYYNKNGSKIEEAESTEDGLERRYFNEDGSLNYTWNFKTGGYKSPIADELKELIYAKNSLGLPVSKSKEIKETVLKKITPDNVQAVIEAYKDAAGVDLVTDIKGEMSISAKDIQDIINHINKCAEKMHDYKSDFENPSSQVKNEYHTGPEFSVIQKGEVITVKNKSTGAEHKIDLEKLLENLNPEEKAGLKKMIQTLPGEVLEDLSINVENVLIDKNKDNYVGFYLHGSDKHSEKSANGKNNIVLTILKGQKIFINEIGHAVASSGVNENFRKINDKELKAFLEAGNNRFNTDDETTHMHSDRSHNYCTYNDAEMFAECYSLLMTGSCLSKECILKYFPETLKAVEQYINERRK